MKNLFVVGLILSALVLACNKKENENSTNISINTNTETVNNKANTTTETKLTEDGFVSSETGTEKEKPEAGKTSVQGKVLFNEKPATDVEVKLCETFNQFSGCSGQQYKTKTDAGGEYLIKGVESKVYDALLVKVFNTNMSIFASSKFGITAAKYKFEADKTFFAPPTNLYKSDIKVQNPKPNAKIDAKNFELKWDAYPDAVYYKFGMYSKNPSVTAPYVNEKTEETSFKADKPLSDGEYNFKLEAFNANDVKLAETDFIAFKISGGEPAPSADLPKD
ncbi:MAG: hypothetical protein ABIP06_04095 [Pyrinomonadaceae bacterium]